MTTPHPPMRTRAEQMRLRLAYLPTLSDETLARIKADEDDDVSSGELAEIHRVKKAKELADKRAGLRH